MTAAPRPKVVLQVVGAKASLAARIVALLGPHGSYVEPYAGSAAVLLAKDRCPVETLNDIDQHVIHFYRTMRDPDTRFRLIDALTYTPYARVELKEATEEPAPPIREVVRAALTAAVTDTDAMTPRHLAIALDAALSALSPEARQTEAQASVERARRFFVRTNQRYVGNDNGGWTCTLKASSGHSNASKWANYVTRLSAVAERLQGVQIECGGAIDVLDKLVKNADPQTAVYLDPPYLRETRSGSRYREDRMRSVHHELLLKVAVLLPGPVVLSSYPNALYEDALGPAGWTQYRGHRKASGQSGKGRTAQRTEVLWANPQCVQGVVPHDFHMVTLRDANGDDVDVIAGAEGAPPELAVVEEEQTAIPGMTG
jgi:DNA adenine methylase